MVMYHLRTLSAEVEICSIFSVYILGRPIHHDFSLNNPSKQIQSIIRMSAWEHVHIIVPIIVQPWCGDAMVAMLAVLAMLAAYAYIAVFECGHGPRKLSLQTSPLLTDALHVGSASNHTSFQKCLHSMRPRHMPSRRRHT